MGSKVLDLNKLKKGDKLRVVSLDNTIVGDSNIEIGDVLEYSSSYVSGERYNIHVRDKNSRHWWVTHTDVELVEDDEQLPTVKSVGVKYDGDKLEYSLVPKGVINKVVKVLGFGAKKYAKDNWRYVDNAKERYYNAGMRHLNQWWEGEKNDPETGENHLAHAMCCLIFLLAFDLEGDSDE